MQRELKCRALCWADDKKQMLYFGMMQFDNGIGWWPTPDDVHHIDEYISPILQYIGITDKNGKEIYEGDIITCIAKNDYKWPAKGHVEYIHKSASFGINVGQALLGSEEDYYAHFYSHEYFEILGNIYENPELLNR